MGSARKKTKARASAPCADHALARASIGRNQGFGEEIAASALAVGNEARGRIDGGKPCVQRVGLGDEVALADDDQVGERDLPARFRMRFERRPPFTASTSVVTPASRTRRQ